MATTIEVDPRCPFCRAGYRNGLWDDGQHEGCDRCGYLYLNGKVVRRGKMPSEKEHKGA